MLGHITPVLLTYNEAANIGRTLSKLAWAKDIVVVDSGSSDGTLEILARFSNVRVFNRPFDSHAAQWRYAVEETQIQTPWVLRLDADYQVTDALRDEMATLDPDAAVNAYRIAFDYAVFGHRVIATLYPPNTILLRRGTFSVWDDGHTERWTVPAPIGVLKSRIIHDDWKATDRWLVNQAAYSKRESLRLAAAPGRIRDRLRLWPPLMPIMMFFYCLFAKGLILNGRRGLYYALQRTIAEASLSLWVLEEKLRKDAKHDSTGDEDRSAH